MIGKHLLLRLSESGRVNPCPPREGHLPLAAIPALCLCLCLYSFCCAQGGIVTAEGPGDDFNAYAETSATQARSAVARPGSTMPPTLTGLTSRTGDQANTLHPGPQPVGGLIPELWSSRITAPAPNEDAETRLALWQLIRQVRSVKFDNGESARSTPPPAAPTITPDPAATGPRVVLTATPTKPAAKPETRSVEPQVAVAATEENGSSLSPKAKRALEGLLQDPGQVHDPLEMAELLFLSGRPTDAVSFYEKALEHTSAGDAATAQDRAWILFQLANCLRETDLSKAQKTYTQLISEYPSSPWTELAKAQGQLVGWYQKDQPHQLMASWQP